MVFGYVVKLFLVIIKLETVRLAHSIMNKLKHILTTPKFKKYAKNSSLLILEKIIRLISSLFIGVWLTRYLGPDSFGIYSYVISFVGLFSIIATFGIDSLIIKELTTKLYSKELVLGTSSFIRFVFGFGAFLLVNLFAYIFVLETQTCFFIFIVSLTILTLTFTNLELYFQSNFESENILKANIIALILSSLMKGYLIYYKYPILYFIINVVLENLLIVIGLIFFYYKNRLSIKNWQIDKNLAKILIKQGWPLLLSSMVVSIYMRIDQIMLEKMLGNEAVGKFSAAIRLTESWYFIPMVISSSFFPSIINAKKISEELYYKRLSQLFKLLTYLSIFIALIFTLFSKTIILFLYGKEFLEAAQVLSITAWAGIFVSLGVISSNWLILENLHMLSFWRTFLGMIINIVLNLILIPRYGISGSAISTLLGQISAALLFDLFNKKTRTIFFIKLKSFIPIY